MKVVFLDFNGIVDTYEDIIQITQKRLKKLLLEEHPEIDNYVILDDDYDMDFGNRMIKLPMQGPGSLGFTEEYYDEAVKVLGIVKDKENMYGRK